MHAPTKRDRMRRLAGAGLIVGLAFATAACSGGGGGSDPGPADPPPLAGSARFGPGFDLAFKAVSTADPRDPVAGDIIPLSLTTDPFEVP